MAVQILWEECPAQARAEEIEVPVVVGVPPVRAHQSPLNVQVLVNLIFGTSARCSRAGRLWCVQFPGSCGDLFRRSESGTRRDSCWTQHQEHTALRKGMEIVLALSPECCCIVHQGEARWAGTSWLADLTKFAAGHWGDLIDASHKCAQKAVTAFRRRQRKSTVPESHYARRALQFVQLGELSSGRQAYRRSWIGTWEQEYSWISCASELMCPVNQSLGCQGTPRSSIWTRGCPSRNVRSAKKGGSSRPVRDDMWSFAAVSWTATPDMHLLLVVG